MTTDPEFLKACESRAHQIMAQAIDEHDEQLLFIAGLALGLLQKHKRDGGE